MDAKTRKIEKTTKKGDAKRDKIVEMGKRAKSK